MGALASVGSEMAVAAVAILVAVLGLVAKRILSSEDPQSHVVPSDATVVMTLSQMRTAIEMLQKHDADVLTQIEKHDLRCEKHLNEAQRESREQFDRLHRRLDYFGRHKED